MFTSSQMIHSKPVSRRPNGQIQEMLTEWAGSVQLTTFYKPVQVSCFLKCKQQWLFFRTKTSYLNEEVNSTERSPSVSVPCPKSSPSLKEIPVRYLRFWLFLIFTITKSEILKFQISLNETEILQSTFDSTESKIQQSTLKINESKVLYQEFLLPNPCVVGKEALLMWTKL